PRSNPPALPPGAVAPGCVPCRAAPRRRRRGRPRSAYRRAACPSAAGRPRGPRRRSPAAPPLASWTTHWCACRPSALRRRPRCAHGVAPLAQLGLSDLHRQRLSPPLLIHLAARRGDGQLQLRAAVLEGQVEAQLAQLLVIVGVGRLRALLGGAEEVGL